MKMLTSEHIILLIAASFVFTSSAYAQHDRMQPGDRGEQHIMGEEHIKRMPMIPDLTEQQKTQIEKLRTEHLKVMVPLKNQLAEKETRLHTISTVENVDMSMVNKLIEEIGAIKTQMMKERAVLRQKIRKLLTESQRLFLDAHPSPRPGSHGYYRSMP